MTTSPFARRYIGVKIAIGLGQNGTDGADIYELPIGLRITANIVKSGRDATSIADIRIHGLTNNLMNKVSALGLSVYRLRLNTISISAGDDPNVLAEIFQGTILEAAHDFQGAPDTALNISAYSNAAVNLLPILPSSYRGDVDVAVILQDLATKSGRVFENNGVSVIISNPYFWGSAGQQINSAIEAANIESSQDQNILAIWPKGGSRNGIIPLVSKETGMVGYPTINGQNNIRLMMLFNPNVIIGGQINVKSIITPASGLWNVFTVAHTLESETPGGQWFTSVEASPPLNAQPSP